MADDDRVKPTPAPRGPALVRPTIGALLLSLSSVGAVGCKAKHAPPPMPPPMPDPGYGEPPMNVPADEVEHVEGPDDVDDGASEEANAASNDGDEGAGADDELSSPPPMPAPR